MPSPSAVLILALVVLIALIAFMASTCHSSPWSPKPPEPIYTTSDAETSQGSTEAPQTIQETTEYTLPETGG